MPGILPRRNPRAPPPSSFSLAEGEATQGKEKKRRFSLFRWRKTVVLAADPIAILEEIRDEPTSSSPSLAGNPDHSGVNAQRQRALFALEGHIGSGTTYTRQSRSISQPASRHSSITPSVVLEDSNVTSSPERVSFFLRQVPEASIPGVVEETHADGLPTYASAAYPSIPVVYQFLRGSPFSMVVSEMRSESNPDPTGLYYISVGLNVWMPTCAVTTIRRGSTEVGTIIASVEMGIIAGAATITMDGKCRLISDIMCRAGGSTMLRTYILPDGDFISWKLSGNTWQAHHRENALASFEVAPPRRLTVQPAGHRLSEHILIALVVLMREHLTPELPECAPLFNYSAPIRTPNTRRSVSFMA